MKAILIMYDSLNKHYLNEYGCDWTKLPNFNRLSKKVTSFSNAYVGSMPCMPARRELHTGRYNFLHRSWGPVEPFDDSMPQMLKESGTYTHLVSDHYHYWEDGGCTYHSRFNTWENIRGQEGDPWKGEVAAPDIPKNAIGRKSVGLWEQDWINRKYIKNEEDFPISKTFDKGVDFIKTNKNEDNWFLQIETFDPHEPFYAPQKFKDLYPHEYDGRFFDWPDYRRVEETDEEIEHCKKEYAALMSMCDDNLGKVLDAMDEFNLWKDTMLIVNTDHGFLLGEHGWWAKCRQPLYNEVVNIPMFLYDPTINCENVRCDNLVQTIDIAPTILNFFGLDTPDDMMGISLKESVLSQTSLRKGALFGVFGQHVCCTDGRYVYMRAPASEQNKPLYDYTFMPTHMTKLFSVRELQQVELSDGFRFTKGTKPMKIVAQGLPGGCYSYEFGNLLFDLHNDPKQASPIDDAKIENYMIDLMIDLMKKSDSPIEQYERLGLTP